MATEITSLKSKSQSISSDVTPDDDNPAADVAVEFVLVLFVTAAAMLELINNSYTLADNVKQGHVKNVQGNAAEWNSTTSNLTNVSEWNISNSANVSWVINHFNSIEHSMNMVGILGKYLVKILCFKVFRRVSGGGKQGPCPLPLRI